MGRFPLGGGDKALDHFPGMIGMGCRAGGDRAGEIPGCHGVGRGPADADHLINPVDDLAGAHIAVAAAGAGGAEKAGRHAAQSDAIVGGNDVFCDILGQDLFGGSAGYFRAAFTTVSRDCHIISPSSVEETGKSLFFTAEHTKIIENTLIEYVSSVGSVLSVVNFQFFFISGRRPVWRPARYFSSAW